MYQDINEVIKSALYMTLSSLKVDVLGGKSIIRSLQAYLDAGQITGVRSGQKRLIVSSDMDSSQIWKIPYIPQGIYDNCNEVVISNLFNELRANNIITDDDLLLFPESNMILGDIFIIEQEKCIVWDEFPDWIKFYNDQVNLYPGVGKKELQLLFVSSIERLRRDHNRIQQIVKNELVACDISLAEEPENYAFRIVNNEARLVLIDYGSAYPIFKDASGKKIYPTCSCGSELHYMGYQLIDAKWDINQVAFNGSSIGNGGLHGCINQSCGNYHKNIYNNGISSDQVKDTFVYADNYGVVMYDHINYAYMTNCNWFIPAQRCGTYNEYKNQVIASTPGYVVNEDEIFSMYINYAMHETSRVFYLDDVETLLKNIRENGAVMSYDIFKHRLGTILLQYKTSLDRLDLRIVSYGYLYALSNMELNPIPITDTEYFIIRAHTYPDLSAQLNRYAVGPEGSYIMNEMIVGQLITDLLAVYN